MVRKVSLTAPMPILPIMPMAGCLNIRSNLPYQNFLRPCGYASPLPISKQACRAVDGRAKRIIYDLPTSSSSTSSASAAPFFLLWCFFLFSSVRIKAVRIITDLPRCCCLLLLPLLTFSRLVCQRQRHEECSCVSCPSAPFPNWKCVPSCCIHLFAFGIAHKSA